MAEKINIEKNQYKNLVKFVALTDTLHDYCNASRINKSIYKYDSESFIHIILGLLKYDFTSIKDSIDKFYNELYTKNNIWYRNISAIETFMEKFVINFLHNKGVIDKNYNDLKNNIVDFTNTTQIESNIFELNVGILDSKIFDSNSKNIALKLYNYLKDGDKNLTFVTDANKIPCSNEFFCLSTNDLKLKYKHFTHYKGIFSDYDAGSKGVTTNILQENSETLLGGSSNSENDENMNNYNCITEDKYPYSLSKKDNELIFVDKIGVKFHKGQFELYIEVKETIKYIDFKKFVNYDKNTLALSTFINLLSLIESTINKTMFADNRLKEYLDESLLKNTTLQTIFDIYQIKLVKTVKKKNVDYYSTGLDKFYVKNISKKIDNYIDEHLKIIGNLKEEINTIENKINNFRDNLEITKANFINKVSKSYCKKQYKEKYNEICKIGDESNENMTKVKIAIYKEIQEKIQKLYSDKKEINRKDFNLFKCIEAEIFKVINSNVINIQKNEEKKILYIEKYNEEINKLKNDVKGKIIPANSNAIINRLQLIDINQNTIEKEEKKSNVVLNQNIEKSENVLYKILLQSKIERENEQIDLLKNKFCGINKEKNLDDVIEIFDNTIEKINSIIIDLKKITQKKIKEIAADIFETLKDYGIITTKKLVFDIVNNICTLKDINYNMYLIDSFEELNNVLKKKKNESTDYIPLEPLEFNKALLDFKRAMDYLQVKACAESNKKNNEVSYVFVSSDRPAILFAMLNNCQCIKTTQIKKDTILTLYNFGKTRNKFNISENKADIATTEILDNLTNADFEIVDENENAENVENVNNEENAENTNTNLNNKIEKLNIHNNDNIDDDIDNDDIDDIDYIKLHDIIKKIKQIKSNTNVSNIESEFYKFFLNYESQTQKKKIQEELENELNKLSKEVNLLNLLIATTKQQSGGRESAFRYMTPSVQSSILKNTYNKFTKSVNSHNNLSKFNTMYKRSINIPKVTVNAHTTVKKSVNSPIVSKKSPSTKRTVNSPTTSTTNSITTDINTYKTTNNNTKNTTRTLYNSKTSKSNKTTNKTSTYSEIDTETYDDNEANLDKTVKIDVLIHMFSEEKLFVKFLEIYKEVYTSEISIFWYITYHTLFFIIDKVYNTKEIDSFIELDKMINQNT